MYGTVVVLMSPVVLKRVLQLPFIPQTCLAMCFSWNELQWQVISIPNHSNFNKFRVWKDAAGFAEWL